MKVLHIINSLHTGGAEKLLADSLPLYQEYGVEVDLFLLNREETPFFKKLRENFQGKIYFSKIKSYYSPLQILEMKKLMQKDYAIIHAHLFPVLYWGAIAKFLFDIQGKLIFTEHNTENRRLNNFLFSLVDRLIYKVYKKIVVITPQVKSVLMRTLKLKEEKIKVIYNGIDVEKYKNSMFYSKTDFFSEEDIFLIQISRFQKQKDQKTLIKALALLPEKYKLLLVGEGELKGECEVLTRELKVSDRVRFLGVRMDVPQLLKTSDIVIQSSHWEGFGLAAVEGLAAGKPVLAGEVEGLSDVIRGYGILFEKGNEQDLAEKIMRLENKEFYNEISQKCQSRAEDFHILKMVEENVKLYKNLMK